MHSRARACSHLHTPLHHMHLTRSNSHMHTFTPILRYKACRVLIAQCDHHIPFCLPQPPTSSEAASSVKAYLQWFICCLEHHHCSFPPVGNPCRRLNHGDDFLMLSRMQLRQSNGRLQLLAPHFIHGCKVLHGICGAGDALVG